MRADRLVALLLILQRKGQVTAQEVALELEISERTARRLWVYARSFLMEELSPEP